MDLALLMDKTCQCSFASRDPFQLHLAHKLTPYFSSANHANLYSFELFREAVLEDVLENSIDNKRQEQDYCLGSATGN